MTDTKNQSNGSGVSPVAAAVTGAVVGAVVGAGVVAGAVAMKDENNREKVKGALNDVKDKAVGYVENIQKQAQDK